MSGEVERVTRKEVMSSGQQVDSGMILMALGVATLSIAAAALLARGSNADPRPRRPSAPQPPSPGADERPLGTPAPHKRDGGELGARPASATVTAARRLNRAAGTLAFSVLADSAMEHYRGSFDNPAMYIAPVVSSAALAISAHGVADRRPGAHLARDVVYSAAALTGLVGTGFHIYNVVSRPGRLSWQNAFYGAPLGAPAAILLSGLLGFMAERVRNARDGEAPKLMGVPAGRLSAGVTAVGLVGTAAEAALLHFRGAYHNPFMFIPVTIPPAAAVVMSEMALGKRERNRAFSRWWLRLTAAIGFAGVGFHAYGVHRNMGGWRNWRQNVLNGPPLPAPPSFAGLALAGLAALALLEERRDA